MEKSDASTPIVDWGRTARRLRAVLTALAGLVVLAWVAIGVSADELTWRLLGELTGIGVLIAFVLEAVIVGGSAIRGLLNAGARGDRLASSDVSILPPQLTRRRRPS